MKSRGDLVGSNENQVAPKGVQKKKKVRTTITLYPDTFAILEMLKIHARRQGNKATFSDILAEAIVDLAQKKGLRLDSISRL